MPAPPNFDYVMCPDGSTAIGDNCGSSVPLGVQEEIALAKITSDPIYQAALKSESQIIVDEQPQAVVSVKKALDTKTIAIVLGVGLLTWYLISKKD